MPHIEAKFRPSVTPPAPTSPERGGFWEWPATSLFPSVEPLRWINLRNPEFLPAVQEFQLNIFHNLDRDCSAVSYRLG